MSGVLVVLVNHLLELVADVVDLMPAVCELSQLSLRDVANDGLVLHDISGLVICHVGGVGPAGPGVDAINKYGY